MFVIKDHKIKTTVSRASCLISLEKNNYFQRGVCIWHSQWWGTKKVFIYLKNISHQFVKIDYIIRRRASTRKLVYGWIIPERIFKRRRPQLSICKGKNKAKMNKIMNFIYVLYYLNIELSCGPIWTTKKPYIHM